MNVLLWFRRDLRIDDHPALAMAAGQGAVMPVFVADPAEWSRDDRAARHWLFVGESLCDLRDALAGRGLSLVLRRGPWRDVMATLVRAYDIGAIHAHAGRDAWEQAQDLELEAWAAENGVAVIFCDPVTPVAMPDQVTGLADVSPGFLPEARALGLKDDPCPQRQRGGRARGLRLAQACASKQLAGFHAAQKRGDPLCDPALAVHLAWGTVTEADLVCLTDGVDATGVTAQDRKAFRDLARTPAMFSIPRWQGGDYTTTTPWALGQSGWPFVDAAMRALRNSGTLPQAVLVHLAQVGIAACALPENAVLTYLARLLTAGALPDTLRSAMADARQVASLQADPAHFGEKADPTGRFILTHVPELRSLPQGFVHRPWDWMQPEATRRYPLPVYRPVPVGGKIPLTQKMQGAGPVDRRQGAFDFGPPCVSAVAVGARSA